MNKLECWFHASNNKKLVIHKWVHYFQIYDRHFKRFQWKNPRILEIGVYKGGSLEMWNHYFDGQCTIVGVDIDPECLRVPQILGASNIQVVLGDQKDRNFWKQFKERFPPFDIIIDDGGHTMEQQITTFEEMYGHVKGDGVYLCEDVHTSYWPMYGGQLKNPSTFIEYSKNFIDYLNTYHINNHPDPETLAFRKTTDSVHYYDSVVVLEKKRDENPPFHIKK